MDKESELIFEIFQDIQTVEGIHKSKQDKG